MSNSNSTKKSQTDWARIDAMTDEDIDFTDLPEVTPEMFKNAVVRKGLKSEMKTSQETLAVDSDIIEYFKSQGQNYRTQINQLLREYMEAHPVK